MSPPILPLFHFAMMLFTASFASSKPRTVDLEKEITGSSIIVYAEVMEYTDTAVVFKTATTQTLISAKTRGKITPTVLTGDKYLTASWPFIGGKVLVVVNNVGYISLFAKRIENNYRFWSPAFTGSLALFRFKQPASCLADGQGIDQDENATMLTCWDGCLLPINEIKEHI
jgi:hypothetical protein